MERQIISRNSNDKIVVDMLGLNVWFDDLLEEAKNTKEVMFIARQILDALDLALNDTMEDDDINPTGEEITVDDVLMEMRGY